LTEGPYRDLGSGFARLTGVEGVRRAPSRIETVEDALLELARNAVDARAENVYVATALHSRRYREIVVLDDGRGLPEPYREEIFAPGVTTRHLVPSRLGGRTHGAGLSLHHIREAALSCSVLSTKSPTSIKAVFDTESLPESSLQSGANARREPRRSLRATLQSLAAAPGAPEIFYGSPASILVTLLNKRIIPKNVGTAGLDSWCGERLGQSPSRRTLQRVLRGEVAPAERVVERLERPRAGERAWDEGRGATAWGGRLNLNERDILEIRGVIERAARESYLEVGELGVETREGEVTVRARIQPPEEEYDG